MIRINLEEKVENKFKEIYLQPRFGPKAPSANKGSSASSEKVSLIDKVQSNISSCLAYKEPQDACLIVAMFLRKQFGDDPDHISQVQIIEYLLRKDLKNIIQSFWQCVSLVWSEKLKKEGKMAEISDAYAGILSRWRSVKEVAMEESDKKKRAALIREVITTETLPFFRGIEESDITSTATRGTVITNTGKLDEVELEFQDDLYAKETGAIAIISGIFDYDLLNGEPRHELLTAMEIPVCPYCNRQYITSYPDENYDKTTADLDHYYCKSLYPYLALSLYNFIPSCQICNSRFKLAKDFYNIPHLYPYEKDPDSEVKFRLGDDSLLFDESAWNKAKISFLEIETTGKAAQNSVQTFHLKDVYQSHKDYVHEIVWKTRIYNDDLIEVLQNQFSELADNQRDIKLFDGTREIQDLVFGQYLDERDAHKRPLAKLTQDLLEESIGWTWPDEFP